MNTEHDRRVISVIRCCYLNQSVENSKNVCNDSVIVLHGIGI
jgi:hypothetical protein